MRVAITGGTGLVGSHLARALLAADHEVVVLSRSAETATNVPDGDGVDAVGASVTDEDALVDAFADCEAVAHLAGINRETGAQTYEAVHVRGTEAVVNAATDAGVSTVALSSFLRARPDCGSGYHESKWRSEEIVRNAPLDHTVLKPGVVYGAGDQMVTHVARSLATAPVFPAIGFGETLVRPLAVEDLVTVLVAALTGDRLTDETVPVLGPDTLTLTEVVERIGAVIGRDPVVVPLPVAVHYALASVQERLMDQPVVGRAQVRMLAEDIVEPAPAAVCTPLPDDLRPERPFSRSHIERALGDVSRYGLADLSL